MPETFGAFALGIAQQMQGILLQAFLFSVAVTRFQMPQSDLFFSDKLLFTNRDDVPHLILRIGEHQPLYSVALYPLHILSTFSFDACGHRELEVQYDLPSERVPHDAPAAPDQGG